VHIKLREHTVRRSASMSNCPSHGTDKDVQELGDHFFAGALDAAGVQLRALSDACCEVPSDLSMGLRAQLRLVDAHAEDMAAATGGDSTYARHMLTTPDVSELYANMQVHYRATVEQKHTVATFETDYTWEDLRPVLVSSKALALVFPRVVHEVTLVKEEGEGSAVLHVCCCNLHALSSRPYEAIVRVKQLCYAKQEHGKPAPVLLVQDASEEPIFQHYRRRDSHRLAPRFSAVVFATQHIEHVALAVCTRRAVTGSALRQALAPWTTDIYVRYLVACALQAWLSTSAKLYHGDRSVYEIKAQLGARSEFSDPFLTP
jgi:hypothetical protein